MGKTNIAWADRVWNPVTGCTPISEGCRRCYAKRMANRLRGRYGYPAADPFSVTIHADRMDEPLHWRKRGFCFVVSMGDLFHDAVPDETIDSVLLTAGKAWDKSGTVFLILTKRAARMAKYFGSRAATLWPMFGIWIGVTVENQEQADARIPFLVRIPAAVRFVSVEPMLGPVDLRDWPEPRISWVICGGETGHGAPMLQAPWVRYLRDQCRAAGTAFWFKQWGEDPDPRNADGKPTLDGKVHEERPAITAVTE